MADAPALRRLIERIVGDLSAKIRALIDVLPDHRVVAVMLGRPRWCPEGGTGDERSGPVGG